MGARRTLLSAHMNPSLHRTTRRPFRSPAAGARTSRRASARASSVTASIANTPLPPSRMDRESSTASTTCAAPRAALAGAAPTLDGREGSGLGVELPGAATRLPPRARARWKAQGGRGLRSQCPARPRPAPAPADTWHRAGAKQEAHGCQGGRPRCAPGTCAGRGACGAARSCPCGSATRCRR